MSLKNIDIGSAMRRLADKRVEDAMREGKFDNLSGAGQPLELDPIPAEENARLTWWAIRILKQNDVISDEVRWRKLLDTLRVRLAREQSESGVRKLVTQINDLVRRINTLGTNAMQSGVVPVCLETQLALLRERTPLHVAAPSHKT
jgi:Domain of unknown function (DUF1992)